ncbi:MAG: asparagine synthase-related protein [Pseudomonadota bacterium]
MLGQTAREQGQAAALLDGWRDYGERVVDQLGGSFGLAVIDWRQGAVLLATDRFGVYPMAWCEVAEGIVFGASAGLVRSHPSVQSDLDPQAIFDYLYFDAIPAPLTVYKNVYRLRAGERLLWREGKSSIGRYWEPTFARPGSRADDRALAAQLRESLGAAVAVASKGAEQLACFLSGGLDSSSVVGLAARQREGTDAATQAYTMGFSAAGFDEMEYARLAASHFGAELRERYISPDEVAEAMPFVAAWYDEPFGNSSAVPAYVCAKTAASEGVTRMIAGDGGDELFAGNSRYVRQQLFGYYDRLPRVAQGALQRLLLLGKTGDHSALSKVPGLSKLVSYVAQARPGMPARYDSYNFVLRYGPQNMLSEDWLTQIDTEHPLHLQADTWNAAPTEDLLQRMLYLDWQFTLADNDLRKVGGMCAAAGVQVRYPMLDDDVLELSLQVPPDQLIHRHRLRHFYKEAMNGFLPRDIINKPKHGFGLPFGIWLKESARLRDVVYPALEQARGRGIIRPSFIDEMVRAHRDGHAYYFGGMLWIIVMLELWMQRHAT